MVITQNIFPHGHNLYHSPVFGSNILLVLNFDNIFPILFYHALFISYNTNYWQSRACAA